MLAHATAEAIRKLHEQADKPIMIRRPFNGPPGTTNIWITPGPGDTAAPPPPSPKTIEKERGDAPPRPRDEGAARSGLTLSAGATRHFAYVPLHGDLMASFRLGAAGALPASGWLSGATLGISAGLDAGRNEGVDAQLYRGGFTFTLGAPYTRDILGVGVEGGLMAGSYYDSNPVSVRRGSRELVNGPHGGSIDMTWYGLARLILQMPLKGDVRPYLAGDFGLIGREDGRPVGSVGATGGLVWNAW
jgi:hypothetical protein